jgi:acetyl esterase/lipase
LPPIHIFAGTHDILQPDEKIFAEKANAAGVDTFYYEYPAMIHGWMFLPIPEAKDAIKKIVGIC